MPRPIFSSLRSPAQRRSAPYRRPHHDQSHRNASLSALAFTSRFRTWTPASLNGDANSQPSGSLPRGVVPSQNPPVAESPSKGSVLFSPALAMQMSLPDLTTSSSFAAEEVPSNRVVTVLQPVFNGDFPSNVIRTSKYTVLNFLPTNLFEQFRRVANVYFLVVILISLVPNVAPFEWWTSAIPLTFILGVSAAKDGYEDYMRHREDAIANNRKFKALRDGQFANVSSGDIVVGDILQICEGHEFPADMVLVSTSKHDNTCYINTANLDGEVTPKLRVAARIENRQLETAESLQTLKGSLLITGRVTKHLEGFEGVLEVAHEEHPAPLGDRQLLLRGAKLISTDHVFAIVLSTGPDTKLMLNRNPIRFKFSSFEQVLNQCVVAALVFQVAICALMAVLAQTEVIIWTDLASSSTATYLFSDFGTYFVLFSFMIPVSLFVTLDFVKIGQAKLIEWDREMSVLREVGDDDNQPSVGREERANSQDDRLMAHVKSSNITDELGQVEFVFTDKTGTLTENKMELSHVSVDGLYVTNTHLPGSAASNDQSAGVGVQPNSPTTVSQLVEWAFGEEETRLKAIGSVHARPMSGQASIIRNFLYCLLVCNDVATELRKKVLEEKRKNAATEVFLDHDTLNFVSTSPDEIALVDALSRNGLVLENAGPSLPWRVRVARTHQLFEFERIAELEFSSDRRRMTVVVRCPDGTARLYTKGASNVIEKMLAKDTASQAYRSRTNKHLRSFASTGSRTLMMATKILSPKDLDAFLAIMNKASVALVNREREIELAFETVEKSLQLLGCTAVEDQLQEGVPDTISQLLKAEITIMMLTGDMQETAVTIARASRVVSADAQLLLLDAQTSRHCSLLIDKYLEKAENMDSQAQDESDKKPPIAMVLNGHTLEIAVTTCADKFLKLFCRCQTIICNRATPAQKSMVVALVKTRLHSVCLAIGDGANDVSMIRKAHVGIGLTGKEGTQAAQSSDFVLHRFCHLRRLLLVHGRYSFLRSSRVVLFSFYKNFYYSLPLFWFSFFSQFSGQAIYDSIVMTMFNMFFSSWPPLLVGVFEKDVLEPSLMRHPEAFANIRRQKPFSLRIFVIWLGMALYQSLATYFLAHFWFVGSEVVSKDGLTIGMWSFGSWICTAAIIIANATFVLMTMNLTGLVYLGALVGPVVYLLFFLLYSTSFPGIAPAMYGISSNLFGTANSYMFQFIVLAFSLLPIPIVNYLTRRYFSTYADCLRLNCYLAGANVEQNTPEGHVHCCATSHLDCSAADDAK